MSLSSFKPQTEAVKFPGGEFAVRGLALEDITVLLRDHFTTVSALWDKYVNEAAIDAVGQAAPETAAGLADYGSVITEALDIAPSLMADVIALAAGEPDQAAAARTLPTGVQLDAIEKVVRLTLEAEGGMGKFLETVNKITGSLADLPGAVSR